MNAFVETVVSSNYEDDDIVKFVILPLTQRDLYILTD